MDRTTVRILVMTSDRYLPALRVFAHLFNKHWGADQPVTVGGFTPPDFDLPSNFTFYSIGRFADYPVNRWSDALIHALQRIPDEQVIVMLEDYWLTGGVDVEAVRMANDYCAQFRYTARFDLTADRACAGGARFYATIDRPSGGQIRIIQSNPDEGYHLSLMAGVWNKDHLLRVLRPGETAQETELNGTPRLRTLAHETIVLGYEKEWQPVRYTLALRAQTGHGVLLLDGVPEADREELKALGYLKPWGIE